MNADQICDLGTFFIMDSQEDFLYIKILLVYDTLFQTPLKTLQKKVSQQF